MLVSRPRRSRVPVSRPSKPRWRRPTCPTSITCSAAPTGITASASATTSSSPTRRNALADAPRRPPVSGSTRTVGIIGWPVEHSLSPAIHNAAFRALELDWIYVPMPVAPSAVPRAIDGFAALGFAGVNVTMPHKTAVADLLDDLSEDARRLRAVNTVVVDGSLVKGHNTDAPGFDRFLRRDVAFDPAGCRALIFGAGGAARACALALAN